LLLLIRRSIRDHNVDGANPGRRPIIILLEEWIVPRRGFCSSKKPGNVSATDTTASAATLADYAPQGSVWLGTETTDWVPVLPASAAA
jgi:hypothetical protein